MSGDNLTLKTQKKDPFTRSKQIYRIGRSLKFCGTVHVAVLGVDFFLILGHYNCTLHSFFCNIMQLVLYKVCINL